MKKAVAVVGMCGSGKSVVADFFCQKGWDRVYFGGVTVSELKRQGIEINEANERKMREGLRQKYGMGAFAVILKDEILEKLKNGIQNFARTARRQTDCACRGDQQPHPQGTPCLPRSAPPHVGTSRQPRHCRDRKPRKGRSHCQGRLLHHQQRRLHGFVRPTARLYGLRKHAITLRLSIGRNQNRYVIFTYVPIFF